MFLQQIGHFIDMVAQRLLIITTGLTRAASGRGCIIPGREMEMEHALSPKVLHPHPPQTSSSWFYQRSHAVVGDQALVEFIVTQSISGLLADN
jgi:hypothetical protein